MARDMVFEPLGLVNTDYIWQERFENQFCYGHSTEQKRLEKDIETKVASAAGSMETSLVDYSIFLSHILALHRQQSPLTNLLFDSNVSIKSKAQFGPLAQVATNENDDISLGYGLGWGILESPYGKGVFKEGHGEGFQHYSILFLDKGIGVLMMSNSDNAESIFKAILELSIADTYTPWRWENYIPYEQSK